ncbi:hypothetical protein J2T57_001537 [Natronocella acetinitrilica]|uniref:Uncharacterized protein n=1 Tax=Natronocella acetinitrilica TaxID=414046 RepID=A0AAE3KAK3_9GAMM|nr:hypothetical protein [Natronocella acetinitrilica]MCP1674435.1 hypothetical protein [Natronocella acetinitrilica]
MGVFDRLFQYTQSVITLIREVLELGGAVERMEARSLAQGERLVRIETIIELAQQRRRVQRPAEDR